MYDTEKANIEGADGQLDNLADSYKNTINAGKNDLYDYNTNTQTIFDPIDISGKVSDKATGFKNYKFDTPLADTFGDFYKNSTNRIKSLGVQNYGSVTSSSGGTGNRIIN